MKKPRFITVRAFILDPEDRATRELAPWLVWLQRNATEKTSELDSELGRASGFRVFVR
jgi:hypothetical protein